MRRSPRARMRSRPRRRAVAGLALVIVATAQGHPPDRRIVSLMECQECRGKELAAVVRMHDSAVVPLRDLVLNGPPPAFVARVSAAMNRPLRTPQGSIMPPPGPVARLLDDYDTVYRVRATFALGAIATDSARHAICMAAARSFPRPEVGRALDSAQALTGGPCP